MCLDPLTVGIAGSVIGGVSQASAANKAAKAQQNAADKDLAFQKQVRAENIQRVNPFYQSGLDANAAYAYEMGLGAVPMIGGTAPTIETIGGTGQQPQQQAPQYGSDARDNRINRAGLLPQNFTPGIGGVPNFWQAQTPAGTRYKVGDQTFATMEEAQAYANAHKTGGTAYGGFQATPGFQWALQQGNNSINALAGARGGLFSGRTLQDLSTYNMGMANQEYSNYLNRLAGMTDMGMGAATAQNNANSNAAAAASNAYAAKGNAAAAGAIGAGNAINSGINNALGLWQYQQGLR